ncbi:MAG: hypothetical protein K2J46_08330, partial [Muribaculaceae bacterium]|nr:hypothetical protein [Muribaculaceae bacterium]
DIRYNPRMIFVSSDDLNSNNSADTQIHIDIEDIKQMTDPREFVRKTAGSYPELTEEDLDDLFREVEESIRKTQEEQ